jgi:hypothetical protein
MWKLLDLHGLKKRLFSKFRKNTFGSNYKERDGKFYRKKSKRMKQNIWPLLSTLYLINHSINLDLRFRLSFLRLNLLFVNFYGSRLKLSLGPLGSHIKKNSGFFFQYFLKFTLSFSKTTLFCLTWLTFLWSVYQSSSDIAHINQNNLWKDLNKLFLL